MCVTGGSAPTLTHQNLTFFKFPVNISGGIHWVAPSVCMPPEDLGSHELTYLGDPISVTFVTNGCQSCPNLKIS